MSIPLISVCLITYNQKDFIQDCINGALSQVASFDLEILIFDDSSNDGTSEICQKNLKKFTGRIKYFRNDNNVGMIGNWVNALQKCSGKYIALCEGDDYWTDPNKLQKQIDFLEANPGYAICFHAVNTLASGNLRPSELNFSDREEIYSILDLAKRNMINTASVVFRNGLIEKFPDWFNKSPVGDYVLHLLNAKKGAIKYFPEVMAVYRGHAGGIWSQKDANYKFENWLDLLGLLLKEDFDFPVLQVLTQQKNKTLNEFIGSLLRENAYDKIKQTIYKYCESSISTDIISITDLLIGRINELENHVAGVKSTRTYKIAKKISTLKQNIYK